MPWKCATGTVHPLTPMSDQRCLPRLADYTVAVASAAAEVGPENPRTQQGSLSPTAAGTYRLPTAPSAKRKRKAERQSRRLKRERLTGAIKEFHESVHVDETNRQLSGIEPSDVIALRTIAYALPERARVAHLFSHRKRLLSYVLQTVV